MQSSDNLYKPKFAKYDSGIHGRYKRIFNPKKLIEKPVNSFNYNFSSQDENFNSNYLTEKNNPGASQKYSAKINTKNISFLFNSYINYTMPQKENNKNISLQSNDIFGNNTNNYIWSKINKNNYKSYNLIKSNNNNKRNITKKNNRNLISTSYNFNNYFNYSYNESILKNNNQNLFNNKYNNNITNNVNNNNSNNVYMLDTTDNEYIVYSKTHYIENKENINANISNNFTVKSNKNTNINRCVNSGIYNTYKTPLNKNLKIAKMINFGKENNRLLFKKNLQKLKNHLNKKEINNSEYISKCNNKSIKRNKKISLVNIISNSNEFLDNESNHSFYEIKPLSNELSNKIINSQNIKTSYISFKNNECSNIENSSNFNINTNILEDKCINKKNNLNIKANNYNKYKTQKQVNMIKSENSKKIEMNINNYDLASIKENLNINNKKYMNNNINNSNNDYVQQYYIKNKKEKQINIAKNEKRQNTYKKIIKKANFPNRQKDQVINPNKIIFNNDGKNKNKKSNTICFLDSYKINNNNRNIYSSPLNIHKEKKYNNNNIIDSNFFSYISSPKDKLNVNKKNLKNNKNIMQLLNINNKTYEEDFKLKENFNLNTKLKPQTSIRISIFGINEPETKKYFLVSFFCSENMKDKPEESSESDF